METMISVIIPVYKVEKYIDQCIQSVLLQTYTQWELILVDDGSPDSSGEICERYSQSDDRIKVIHKKNGGLSDARNVALDMIKGKYVTFVDSDDYISPVYLDEMINCIIKYDADVVQCDLTRNVEDIGHESSKEALTIIRSDEILRSFLRFGKPQVFACGKIYKSELFSELRFPVGLINEDNFTTYKILHRIDTFININRYLYFYRTNENSITNRAFNTEKFTILNCIEDIIEYLGSHSGRFIKDIRYYEMRQLVQIYNNALEARADREYKSELKRIKERIHAITRSDIGIDIKYKLIVFCLLNTGFFYKWIVLILR